MKEKKYKSQKTTFACEEKGTKFFTGSPMSFPFLSAAKYFLR